ncbi:uncharacterized protein LOC106464177 [Limulus polyphemus]|uniref:Uncharacterized protein LOC106464177 n=1 Tax=Limulus polyphemus TaxID=6850 RepID=A0ABM1SVC1_LIMPO|nr:uncharacterized protein LOC106464177 [Limulus polyphemus]
MIESAEQFIISHSCSVLETDTKPLTSSIREDAADQDSGHIQSQSSSQDVHHPRYLIKGRTKGIGGTQSITPSVSLINPTKQKMYLDEYIRDEVIVLLGMAFISSFCQTTLEIILVFVVIRIISKRFSDRSMLLMGVSILCLALGWSLACLPTAKPNDKGSLPYLIVGIIIDLLGIPFLFVCSTSLLSKVTSNKNQALSQGLRRTMVSLGCIIGPLWGGALLEPRFRYILFAVPFAVCILITVMFLGSYRRLKTTTNISSNCSDQDIANQNDGDIADTHSLLSNT